MTPTSTPAEREFLTTAEAAKVIAVAQDKINDFINDGSLQAVNVARHSGGIRPRRRISRQALDQFLAARQSQQPPSKPVRKRSRGYARKFY